MIIMYCKANLDFILMIGIESSHVQSNILRT